MNDSEEILIKYWWFEWKVAEIDGDLKYAGFCKEQYRCLVMDSLKRPYKQYEEALKAYPPIWLN